MREERIVSALRRALGLAMIVAGISIAAVQLAKGGAPTHAGQAGAAPVQAVEVPRIENAKLEAARRLVVLYRLEAKQVVKIRVASEDCVMDAGGLPFVWLTGVKAQESVALLATYVRSPYFEEHGERKIGNGAWTAIALHAD